MERDQNNDIRFIPWTGTELELVLIMTVESMKVTIDYAESRNITVRCGPFIRSYREILSIAHEYGKREIPKTMRDIPLDIK
ncbi:hypothetical protein M2263_000303 [Providencia alcalifaciens]|nr:hypothetical protein [Providencia alcalifaciens]